MAPARGETQIFDLRCPHSTRARRCSPSVRVTVPRPGWLVFSCSVIAACPLVSLACRDSVLFSDWHAERGGRALQPLPFVAQERQGQVEALDLAEPPLRVGPGPPGQEVWAPTGLASWPRRIVTVAAQNGACAS
jgi:hypothetical protein